MAVSVAVRAARRAWRLLLLTGLLLGLASEGQADEQRLDLMCASGKGYACTADALLQPDEPSAPGLFDRACRLNDGGGCLELAYLLLRGEKVTQDVPRARELLGKACDLHVGRSCAVLGLAYAMGGMQSEKDYTRVLDLFERGCALLHPLSCTGLARLYETGLGREQDVATARRYYELACSLGERSSCAQAEMLGSGDFKP